MMCVYIDITLAMITGSNLLIGSIPSEVQSIEDLVFVNISKYRQSLCVSLSS